MEICKEKMCKKTSFSNHYPLFAWQRFRIKEAAQKTVWSRAKVLLTYHHAKKRWEAL